MNRASGELDVYASAVERGGVLSGAEAAAAMELIADGATATEETARFLRAFNLRMPAVEELTAFVTVLRERAVSVEAPAGNTICNCGTGGDGRGTINISTMAAFVASACGAPVAKHGNRSVSSRSGSTDCLTALGVRASRSAEEAQRLLDEENLCFLNAPDFHPAVRHAGSARAELAREGQKSVFNLLGPMLNPANVRRQSMGVFSKEAVELAANVLLRTGTEFGYVMWGDGYDELTLTGVTCLATIADGSVTMREVTPESLGFDQIEHNALCGGDAKENARIGEGILMRSVTGAVADAVVANAGAAVSAAMMPGTDLAAGVALARDAVADGRAFEKLQTMRRKAPADA